MDDTITISKVYVQTDERGRIIRCEGGYTAPVDLSGWTEIDEGVGDRFNLAQSHYFPGWSSAKMREGAWHKGGMILVDYDSVEVPA